MGHLPKKGHNRMTKFLIGLLLGLILGVAGASAFLITAGGGDYFVGASPRVRELEASLREADQERQWLRGRLSEATEMGNRLESRFITLAARFEALGGKPADTIPSLDTKLPKTAPSAPPSPTKPLAKPAAPATAPTAAPAAQPSDPQPSAAPTPPTKTN
jgi:hypothetical protein